MCRCLILLSTYNGEKYLPELLESVLAQKNIYVDILARDDGSTDKTVEILKKYDRVKVYGGNNLKPAKSFLDLIWKADINYDYYALCDQDDVWKEEKIISAVKCIENIDKPALYSSAVEVVDKDLTFIRKSFTDNTFKNPLYDILTYGTPGCTFVFNKALMEKLKQYKPSVISMHDSWISFVCLAVNGFFYSDQNAYIMYRQHDANVLGAQRHSLKDTLRGIIKNKNVLRSDMAKEILKGYSEMMPEKTKEDFIFFAEYAVFLLFSSYGLHLPHGLYPSLISSSLEPVNVFLFPSLISFTPEHSGVWNFFVFSFNTYVFFSVFPLVFPVPTDASASESTAFPVA